MPSLENTTNSNITDLMKGALGSFAAVREALERETRELQDRDRQLAEQRDAIAENTLSLDDYLLLLKADVQHCGERYAASGLLAHPPTEHPDMLNTWTDYQAGMLPQFVGLLNAPLTMGALCFLFPELVYARLAEALTNTYGGAWPNSCDVPYAEREQRIKDIDQQRTDLRKRRRALHDQEEQLNRAAGQH